jgi:hypothetical protein
MAFVVHLNNISSVYQHDVSMEVKCVFVHLNVDKEIEGNICCNENKNMGFYVF